MSQIINFGVGLKSPLVVYANFAINYLSNKVTICPIDLNGILKAWEKFT